MQGHKSDILPVDSSGLEQALEQGRPDLPVSIVDAFDPSKTPAELLPWLAAHEGLRRFWYEDWSEDRKRQIVADWTRLARLVGTRAAAEAFLSYVDTSLVHKRSYPSRFPVGRIAARITPIQFPAFTARFLLSVMLRSHRRAMVIGRSAVGAGSLTRVDRKPLRRAKAALVASKVPSTGYTVTFARRIPITLDDGIDLAAGHPFGAFRDRKRL